MEIYYEGTNITDLVQTNTCIVRDTAGGRCDSLELEFENAAGWYSWGPEEDDTIIVTHSGYDSGIMYVNKIFPEDGRYKILAASLPCNARKKIYKSYINKSIETIMQICAIEDRMDFRLFGIEGKTIIPYIEQNNEGDAAFLSRLLKLESAALKCVNGKYTAIGFEYAQEQDAKVTIEMSAGQDGTTYRRDGTTYKGVRVVTPYASASAEDTMVSDTHSRITINHLPALNDVQAGRWARGTLLDLNRQCESVVMKSIFNPYYTAMVRVDIEGDTDATGEWLIDEAEHDLINMETTVTMRRCIWTVR